MSPTIVAAFYLIMVFGHTVVVLPLKDAETCGAAP